MTQEEVYVFYSDASTYTVQLKNGKRHYYVTGYITTKDRDLINDVVTEEAMQGMLVQLVGKNLKLDVEHEAWIKENPSIIPLGRIIEANKDDKGIFVKAELNANSTRFTEVWNSIKDKFIDGFSIAYIPVKAINKVINGVESRLLQEVKLLNVALTGNPMNPQARIHEVLVKSLNDFKQKEEEKIMVEIKAKEEVKVEAAVVAPVVDVAELKSLLQESVKAINENIEAKFAKYDEALKAIKLDLEKPMLKSLRPDVEMNPTQLKAESKAKVAEVKRSPLDFL